MTRPILLIAALLSASAPLFGQAAEAPESMKEEIPEPRSSSTRHQVRIGGETVAYTATAGCLIVTDAEEKPAARFGYTAYARDGAEDLARRPVTFAFNGGPGSSSIWLHMGVLGPRRVAVAPALLKGSRLGEAERAEVLAKLAGYTGVDEEYWAPAYPPSLVKYKDDLARFIRAATAAAAPPGSQNSP